MQLHVIGNGCPAPHAQRYGSAFVLEFDGHGILVDCGPGTTYKMARMGLSPLSLDHVFLTHHHFDHQVDLPCFALTRWDQATGTEPPLAVYGPPPTLAFVEGLFGERGVFAIDWKSRIEHPASHACHRQRKGIFPRPPPAIVAHEVDAGEVARTAAWTATAARVHHVEPTMRSLAYRFETAAGSLVFSGDCGDGEALRALCRGADTLVLACTHFGPPMDRALTDVITGTPEVIAIARECRPRRIVLTHMSPNFAVPGVRERAVSEIARAYDGILISPDEMTTIRL